jgi:hypothetical protein
MDAPSEVVGRASTKCSPEQAQFSPRRHRARGDPASMADVLVVIGVVVFVAAMLGLIGGLERI